MQKCFSSPIILEGVDTFKDIITVFILILNLTFKWTSGDDLLNCMAQ